MIENMGFNEKKSNNNWRIAMVMLSSDIKNKGTFSLDMKSGEFVRNASDLELESFLDMDAFQTTNDVINNIMYNISCEHPRNPNSNKFWRGDIQDCYAMLKNIVYVHIMASTVRNPAAFGWSEEDWDNLKSGRYLLSSYTEYKVFREAFLCETDRDMGYLYQKIMSIVEPQPTEGVVSVPVCKYEFKR